MPHSAFRLVGASRAVVAGLLLSVLAICPVLRGDDALHRISEEDAKKAAITKITPEYPPMAKQMKLAGKVLVDAVIDAEGSVEKVQILTGNLVLASATVAAVKRWKFTPYTSEGKPTRSVATLSFNFTP